MSRRMLVLLAVLCGSGLFVLAQNLEGVSESIQRVLVTNFPEVWKIEGEVSIPRPIRLAQLVSFPDVLVPPVQPTDTPLAVPKRHAVEIDPLEAGDHRVFRMRPRLLGKRSRIVVHLGVRTLRRILPFGLGTLGEDVALRLRHARIAVGEPGADLALTVDIQF